MQASEIAELMKGLSELIGTISWPLVIVFILLYFGRQLRAALHNAGELKLKVGTDGVEASFTKQQVEAAALLGAAVERKGSDGVDGSPTGRARDIATVVAETVRPSTTKRLESCTVLWVDDRPSNNIGERMALEALGIRFVTSLSTEDALDKLRAGHYDLVISDMGRPPDSRAGYTLLSKIRDELRSNIPFLVYAGSNAPEHDAEARRRGANGSTASPSDLFQRVVSILEREGSA